MTFWTCHLLVGLQEAKSAAARMKWCHGSVRTRVGSEPRSDVTPTCSLRIGEHDSRRQTVWMPQAGGGEGSSPSHRQQIIPVNALVLPNLIVCADTASVDHDTSLRVRLGVEQVVAFGAEMKRSLYSRTSGEGSVRRVRCKPPNT